MRKWLITLSIIFGVGAITSATLAGRVYYSDLQTYEDYDKQALNIDALQKVTIVSDVPVEVQPTTGEPYVEFTQKFTDLVGLAPKFELEIDEQSNETHIQLRQVEDMFLWLGVKENQGKLTVYLPEGTMDSLDIYSQNYQMNNRRQQSINLENISVGKLEINAVYTDIKLDGSYDKVNINSSGSLNMNSKSPVKLSTVGMGEQEIEGLFEKIEIKPTRGEVSVKSLQPCYIEIESDRSSIQLEGQYEKIKINGNNTELELNSETECKLVTSGYNNSILANGAFKVMDLGEEDSEVEIQTTVIPERVKLLEASRQTSMNLTLPSNIQGITLKYMSQNETLSEYYAEDLELMESPLETYNTRLESDFLPFSQEIENGYINYQYGNGEVPIIINKDAQIALELIDGGYTSVSKEN